MACARNLSVVLHDIGTLEVDSMDTTHAVDGPSWQYLFEPDVRSRRELMHFPTSGVLGQTFLEMLDKFPVCSVSSDIGPKMLGSFHHSYLAHS